MGLDMYLTGKVHLWRNWEDESKNVKRDGFLVTGLELELGYWRKHPDLHGFIVQTFAGGKDECQEINLSSEQLIEIIEAVKNKKLPKTSGFFFGASDGSEDEETIQTLQAAIQWLEGIPVRRHVKETVELAGGTAIHVIDLGEAKKTNETREVIYRASW